MTITRLSPADGGVYSTPADMACYLTALLHGGANEHGRVLTAGSVRAMFRPCRHLPSRFGPGGRQCRWRGQRGLVQHGPTACHSAPHAASRRRNSTQQARTPRQTSAETTAAAAIAATSIA